MAEFFAELKRRQMYRVAAAYAVVAWLLLQLINNVAPALRLPEWAAAFVLVLLVLGFPVALLFCWIQHLAPKDGAGQTARTAKLDWLLLGALLLVIALVSYQQLAPPEAGTAQQAASIAPASSAAPPGAISVAVLPFVNLSSDKEQEFFSDGMTEEITSALAKVPNLRVVGRTSAFQFKNENKDLRAIGQALSASHLIEGSVRKDGTEVRITVQLIRADDGTHLWTESYNRELRGVFAIQEEIARAIATSLQIPLGLKQGETLVSNRTGNLDAYQEYLRARTLIRARDITGAIAILDRSVPRNPSYAPGWALLALAYEFFPIYELDLGGMPMAEAQATVGAAYNKAEMAARKAIELDPNHPSGYTALAWSEMARKHWAASDDLFKEALLRDPDDPDALHYSTLAMIVTGRVKQALEVRQKLRALDPFVPIYNVYAGLALQLNGRGEEGLQMLASVPPQGPVGVQRNIYLAIAYAATGRRNLAADALLATTENQRMVTLDNVEIAARLLREGPAKAGAAEMAPDPNYYLSFVQALNGSPDVLLRGIDLWLNEIGFTRAGPAYSMWHPAFAPARKTERFKEIVRKAGLVDYWRTRGWPDLCHPATGDDFECD